MTDIPQCSYCQHKPVLRRILMRDGEEHHTWWCNECDRPAVKGKPYIGKKQIAEWRANGRLPEGAIIPIARDYSRDVICEACGNPGGQLHHWRPQAFAELVSDHSAWPTSYLCKDCHRKWHNIVTPYLPGFGNAPESYIVKEKYLLLEQTT